MILTPDVVKDLVEHKLPFLERMGIQVDELRRGYAKVRAPLQGNENHIGTMYAGALFSLAEVPPGILLYTAFDADIYYPVLKEMNVRFKAPVMGDAVVEVSMSEEDIRRIGLETDENGKSEFVIEGAVKDAEGNIAAETRGTYQLRRHQSVDS